MLLRIAACRPVRRFEGTRFWLVPAILCLSGCAQSPARTMARLWDGVPKMRWSLSSDDAEETRASDSTKTAAKSKARSSDEQEVAGNLRVSSKRKQAGTGDGSSDRLQARNSSSPNDPFLEDELERTKQLSKSDSRSKEWTQQKPSPVVSHRDRLRAALSDDSRRIAKADPPSDEQARLRLRVESMMARARFHLDCDELVAAQRTAELAQSLSENGGLEFAPNEERPIELLKTIVARLEAERHRESLASHETEELADADISWDEELPDSTPARPQRRSADPAFARQQDALFDPYADDAHQNQVAPRDRSIFNTAMVVLESPSFDEEAAAVNPTAFTQDVNVEPSDLELPLPETDDESDGSIRMPPKPPKVRQIPVARVELPELPEPEPELPSDEESPGPELGSMTLDDIPPDLDDAVTEEEIQPAGSVPRWLPLSVLSLLTAGLSVWLWRNRTMLSS